MSDPRISRAAALLAEHGLAPRVSVAGQAADILAIDAAFTNLTELRDLAPALKALGFRYVALELNTENQS